MKSHATVQSLRRGYVMIGWLFALAFALILAVPTPFAAQSGSSFDWQSGNQYRWNRNYDGATDVRGFNFNTGSMWNTRIQPNGDMRGMDSRDNSWNYNSRTGTYWNSDGTFCTGKGYARVCN